MTLQELATLLDTQIKILYPNVNGEYYAELESVEIMDGGCLVGSFGAGVTPEIAMQNYVNEIKGERIAYKSFTDERREFQIPETLTTTEQGKD